MISRLSKKLCGTSVRYFSAKPSVAVLLHGCGVYDGTEATEAVSVLISIGNRADIQCFAPEGNQMHVVDHTAGSEMEESRNILKESARIARGNVKPLSELNAADYSALIVPGGFGAAKNLCNFAVEGANMTMNAEVERVVRDFHAAGKPQGFCCIAPVIPAKVLGATVTMGSDDTTDAENWPHAGATGAIEPLGGTHVVKGATHAHTDETNRVVTSPAYMYNGRADEIFESVKSMVDGVLKLL